MHTVKFDFVIIFTLPYWVDAEQNVGNRFIVWSSEIKFIAHHRKIMQITYYDFLQ